MQGGLYELVDGVESHIKDLEDLATPADFLGVDKRGPIFSEAKNKLKMYVTKNTHKDVVMDVVKDLAVAGFKNAMSLSDTMWRHEVSVVSRKITRASRGPRTWCRGK